MRALAKRRGDRATYFSEARGRIRTSSGSCSPISPTPANPRPRWDAESLREDVRKGGLGRPASGSRRDPGAALHRARGHAGRTSSRRCARRGPRRLGALTPQSFPKRKARAVPLLSA